MAVAMQQVLVVTIHLDNMVCCSSLQGTTSRVVRVHPSPVPVLVRTHHRRRGAAKKERRCFRVYKGKSGKELDLLGVVCVLSGGRKEMHNRPGNCNSGAEPDPDGNMTSSCFRRFVTLLLLLLIC
jgi:hypothetical protein